MGLDLSLMGFGNGCLLRKGKGSVSIIYFLSVLGVSFEKNIEFYSRHMLDEISAAHLNLGLVSRETQAGGHVEEDVDVVVDSCISQSANITKNVYVVAVSMNVPPNCS